MAKAAEEDGEENEAADSLAAAAEVTNAGATTAFVFQGPAGVFTLKQKKQTKHASGVATWHQLEARKR